LLQHYGHHGGLRRRTYNLSVPAFRQDRFIAVDSFRRNIRQEKVSWDGPESLFDTRGLDVPFVPQILDIGIMESSDPVGP
jgi:hypothetical protein